MHILEKKMRVRELNRLIEQGVSYSEVLGLLVKESEDIYGYVEVNGQDEEVMSVLNDLNDLKFKLFDREESKYYQYQ